MASLELNFGPGSLLLWSWLYYLGGGAALTAAFTAMLVHELGHLFVLSLYGADLRKVRLTAAGPVLHYIGPLPPGREALVTAAGPFFGLLFTAAAFLSDTPYFRYAGLVSVLCSLFNLLPAYPMDGGRLALLFLEASLPLQAALICTRVLGALTGAATVSMGIVWRSPVVAAAGIFMVANAIKMR